MWRGKLLARCVPNNVVIDEEGKKKRSEGHILSFFFFLWLLNMFQAKKAEDLFNEQDSSVPF